MTSHHYQEKQVNIRQYHDMADEVAHELVSLPPFTAYVKTTGKHKIKTSPLPQSIQEGNITIVIGKTHDRCCKERMQVEEELRRRRERALQSIASKHEDTDVPDDTPPTSFRKRR